MRFCAAIKISKSQSRNWNAKREWENGVVGRVKQSSRELDVCFRESLWRCRKNRFARKRGRMLNGWQQEEWSRSKLLEGAEGCQHMPTPVSCDIDNSWKENDRWHEARPLTLHIRPYTQNLRWASRRHRNTSSAELCRWSPPWAWQSVKYHGGSIHCACHLTIRCESTYRASASGIRLCQRPEHPIILKRACAGSMMWKDARGGSGF